MAKFKATFTISERRITAIAASVLALDQLSKFIVLRNLEYGDQSDVIPGFFRWVHWGNTGAAWSQFHGNNGLLAGVACIALALFWRWRSHFEASRLGGQIALGCLFGGIVGNLVDRLIHKHVIDFLYFHCITRSQREVGFPAFNVADMGITTSVVLLLYLAWNPLPVANPPAGNSPQPSTLSTAAISNASASSS